jgi:hypothetical protein
MTVVKAVPWSATSHVVPAGTVGVRVTVYVVAALAVWGGTATNTPLITDSNMATIAAYAQTLRTPFLLTL